MIYSLTDKLNFDENPKIEIKDKTLEVKADAETVLSLMDVIQNSDSEMQATLDAANLLFSEEDVKIIKALKLGFKDYVTLITTAINLAIGEDPDAEENSKGEE